MKWTSLLAQGWTKIPGAQHTLYHFFLSTQTIKDPLFVLDIGSHLNLRSSIC